MKSIVYDVTTMSDDDRRTRAHEVWCSVNRRVFTSVSPDEFFDYFIGSDAPHNKLQTLHSSDGVMCGYVSVRAVTKRVDGRSYGIVRAATCILPAYRGKSRTTKFIFGEIARCYLSNILRGRRTLFFFTANSPATFYAVARYARRIYPTHRKQTSSRGTKLVRAVGQAFGLMVDADGTTTYDGVVMHEEARDTEGWERHPHPAVKLYLDSCPRYLSGQSLAVVVPLALPDIVMSFALIAYDRLLKALGRRRSTYRGASSPLLVRENAATLAR